MNDTIDAPADEQPLTDTISDAPATEAPADEPDVEPGQTTADAHGDVLGI
jgi:hypothetical protein